LDNIAADPLPAHRAAKSTMMPIEIGSGFASGNDAAIAVP
jgi:hypothetical protein